MLKRALHKAVLACGLLLLPSSIEAQSGVDEYYAKAGFIYNFVKFVDWPGGYNVSKLSSINICVIGKNPFGSNLDLIRKSSTAKLKLNVATEINLADAKSCHLLFISASEQQNLSQILAALKGVPVLTVSEIEGFSTKGGIVEFTTIEKNIGVFSKNKISFKINNNMAREMGLTIDPQLLELAQSVE